MTTSSEFNQRVLEHKRAIVRELLSQCTEQQRALFHVICGDVDAAPEDKLEDGYNLCARTIKANKERQAREVER